MVRDDSAAIGLRRWRLADMLVRGDDAGLVTDLVGAAVWLAADDGGHVLEVGGMASTLQATIDILHPLRRRLPTWPCFFRMATGIDAPTGWYLSAYDGDTILF